MAGGRKDGSERQIEKRKEIAEAMHGAAKDREDARMGGVELNTRPFTEVEMPTFEMPWLVSAREMLARAKETRTCGRAQEERTGKAGCNDQNAWTHRGEAWPEDYDCS